MDMVKYKSNKVSFHLHNHAETVRARVLKLKLHVQTVKDNLVAKNKKWLPFQFQEEFSITQMFASQVKAMLVYMVDQAETYFYIFLSSLTNVFTEKMITLFVQ